MRAPGGLPPNRWSSSHTVAPFTTHYIQVPGWGEWQQKLQKRSSSVLQGQGGGASFTQRWMLCPKMQRVARFLISCSKYFYGS